VGEREPVAFDAVLTTDAVSFEGERLDVADLVLLGLATGAWPRFEAEVGRGLALERDGAVTISPAELKERATQFRYAHRLLSASEFTSWLAARSLTIADLSGVLGRELLRERVPAGGGAAGVDELAGVLRAEALCGGILRTLADAAVERMAAAYRLSRLGGQVADDRVEAAVADALGLHASGVAALGEEALRARLRRLWAYQDALAAVREQVAEPAALRRQVAGHGLDWLRLEGRRLRLLSEDAAREARALITDDGLGAEEVAAIAGTAATADSLYLEEMAGQVAGAMAAAVPGDVSPPWLQDDQWNVLAVTAKTPPSAADPVLRERATDEILAGVLRRQAAGRARLHGVL
jgi:hypothetical protein